MLLNIENSGEEDCELSYEWLVNTHSNRLLEQHLCFCLYLLSNVRLSCFYIIFKRAFLIDHYIVLQEAYLIACDIADHQLRDLEKQAFEVMVTPGPDSVNLQSNVMKWVHGVLDVGIKIFHI